MREARIFWRDWIFDVGFWVVLLGSFKAVERRKQGRGLGMSVSNERLLWDLNERLQFGNLRTQRKKSV